MEKQKNENKIRLNWVTDINDGAFRLMPVMLIFLLISSAATVAIAYILKLFIDIAGNEADLSLNSAIVYACVILLIGALSSVIAYYIKSRMSANTEAEIRLRMMKRVLSTQYHQNETLKKGDLLIRFTSDAEYVSSFFPNFMFEIFGSASLAIFALISMFMLSKPLFFAILIAVPVLILVLSAFNIPIGHYDKSRKESVDKCSNFIDDSISNGDTIRANRYVSSVIPTFRSNVISAAKGKIRFGMWEGIAIFFNNVLGTLMVLITLGIGSYVVIRGHATIGTLVAMIQLLNYIMDPVSKISVQLSQIKQNQNSSERIQELLSGEPDEESVMTTHKVDCIELNKVGFSYDDRVIINDLSMSFEKGKLYVVTGKNGTGKSTLLKLITGLRIPTDGTIRYKYNGSPIAPSEQADFYISFTDESLFDTTIKDNITMFDETLSEDQLKSLDIVNNLLSSGSEALDLDRVVDRSLHPLSSGQIRKITILRTLIRDGAVMIYDEPCVNMDVESKEIFLRHLSDNKGNNITIVVSHDEDVIDIADVVYELSRPGLEESEG